MDEPTTTNQDGTPNSNPVEDRIAAIVGQRNAAQDQASELATQNQELAGRINSLEATIKGLVTGSGRTEPPAGELESLATSGAPKPSAPAGKASAEDIASVVQRSIAEALKPMQEERRAEREQQALNVLHQRSFNDAAEQMPDLLDRDSQLSKTVSRIWESRADLQKLPDAPALVAHIAKGILQDARRAEKETTQRKAQAAISSTTRPTPNLLSSEGDTLKEYADKVTEDILARETRPSDLGNMFRAELSKLAAERGV